jgi:hypothetical protein
MKVRIKMLKIKTVQMSAARYDDPMYIFGGSLFVVLWCLGCFYMDVVYKCSTGRTEMIFVTS